MNAEALLAKTLGDDEQEKLAAHFEQYTTDELAELLMEKTALSGKTVGTALAKRVSQFAGAQGSATKQALRPGSGVLSNFKAGRDVGKQVAYAHPQYKSWMKQHPIKGQVAGFHYGQEMGKMSSVKVADSWGRELAHEDIEKAAAGVAGMPSMTPAMPKPPKVGVGSMMPKPGGAAGGIPKIGSVEKMAFLGALAAKAAPYLTKAMPAIQRVAQSGVGTAAGVGAAGGAVLGAGRHMMSARDPQTGQKRTSLMGSMLGGAALGAGAGLGARSMAQKFGPGMQSATWKQAPQKMLPGPGQTTMGRLPGGPASKQVVDVPFSKVSKAMLRAGASSNPW